MAFVDRCIWTAASSGLGDFTPASAVVGYLTPVLAGATVGLTYSYTAETYDAGGAITAWEVGRGVWNGSTIARTTILFSSNSNAKVNFATVPRVFLTILAEDLPGIAWSIGSPILGAVVGAVLFVGAGFLLAQDPAKLLWDDTNGILSVASGLSFASGGVINWNNGAFTITESGNGIFAAAGADTNIYIGKDTVNVHYNLISLNGITNGSSASLIGIGAGATADGFLYISGRTAIALQAGTTPIVNFYPASGGRFQLGSTGQFGWTSTDPYGALDTFVSRGNQSDTMAMLRGGNPQAFHLYNTNDGVFINYERGVFDWKISANVLTIGTQQGGTGVARDMAFVTGGVEAARIDVNQRLLVGLTASTGSQFRSLIQSQDAGNVSWGISIFNINNHAAGLGASVFKTRGGSATAQTILLNGDAIGDTIWQGSDGTTYRAAAELFVEVDGAPGAGSMPGRFRFCTSPTGAATPVECFRLDNAGNATFGGFGANATLDGSQSTIQVVNSGTPWSMSAIAIGNTANDAAIAFAKTRGANPTTQTIVANNDGLGELNFYGSDGTGYKRAAFIRSFVDGTPGAGSMPARLSLWVSPAGTAAPVERWRLDNTGQITHTTGASNTIIFGKDTAATNYNILSLNGVTTDAGNLGLVAGAAGDGALYIEYTSAAVFLDAGTATPLLVQDNGTVGGANKFFAWSSNNNPQNAAADTFLTRAATAAIQLGNADAAAPIAQTLQVQSVVAGTTNTAGTDWSLVGSKGTGTGAGGKIIFKTAPAGTTGSAQNAAASVLQIDSAGNTQSLGTLGYGTGVGGTVTQITSRTTGVTLNKICGAITMFSAAGSTTAATFTVTNSTVAATDTIILDQKSGTNLYVFIVTAVAAGSFNITFFTTGGVATDAPVINFAVIKAVTN